MVHLSNSEYTATAAAETPEQNDIRVEYHPRSEIPPKHFPFADYTSYNSLERDDTQDFQTNQEPWRPFNSRLDFEVAELILETHLNRNQTNSLLSLIKRCTEDPSSFSLKNSKEIDEMWDASRGKTTTVS